jgi:hypothetical protein
VGGRNGRAGRLGGGTRAVTLGVRSLAAALLLALAGCATSVPPPQPAGPQPVPADPTSPAPSLPPPGPSPPGLALGQSAQANNGQVQATVFAYKRPVGADPPAGTTWAAADVKVCAQPTSIFDVSISRGPWLMLGADNRPIPASLTADSRFPQPAYPTTHRQLHPGDCVRGWIAFAVPAGTQPLAVQYAPADTQPVNWSLH